jgi:hypothetical protein
MPDGPTPSNPLPPARLVPIQRPTSDRQIRELHRAPEAVARWILGNHFDGAESLTGSPRNQDGTYNLRELTRWATARHKANPRRVRAPDATDMSIECDGDGMGALHRKRLLEGRRIELQLVELERQVVPMQFVDDFFDLVDDRLRQLAADLTERFGAEAKTLAHETIDDMNASAAKWRHNSLTRSAS